VAPIVFHPAAVEDLEYFSAQYGSYPPHLSDDFRLAVMAAMQPLMESPEMYQKIWADYRRVLIDRFPFCIYYRLT
jgi:toxin ParE1/3/4